MNKKSILKDKKDKTTIGIPQALFYHQHFPFWRTFFENLGLGVIVSPKTNREILAEGSSRLTSEICLPVKAFCGHVLSLKGRCDFLFIPSFHNFGDFEDFGAKRQGCPKHIGLPDLIKSAIPEILPKTILEPDIDLSKGRDHFYLTLTKIGTLFTSNPLGIKKAIEEAFESQKEFEQKAKQKEKKWYKKARIGLLAHSYLLQDEYLNHQIVSLLKKMEIEVLFPAMAEKGELKKSFSFLIKTPYWSSEEEIIGAGVYFTEKERVDGLILISVFGCGPDSVMVDLLETYAKKSKVPFLHIVLDEHSADTGLVTRIEAFVDTVFQRKKDKTPTISFHKIAPVAQKRILKLGLPYLGGRPRILRKIFKENFGISLILPPATARTIELGVKYSPVEICFPFKVMLGTFIECLEEGADTLVTIGNLNACRNRYYDRLHEEILRKLKYEFRFFKAEAKDKGIFGALKTIKGLTNNAPFSKILFAFYLGIQKLKALDIVEKEVQKVRARELNKGEADKIFEEVIKASDETMSLSSLKKITRQYLKKLKEIPQDQFFDPPKIVIVGEIYVIIEPFVNMEVEKELGRLGAITERIPSTYLSEYINFFRGDPLTREKRRLKHLTDGYLKREVGGHALESLGTKIEAVKKYDGIVHLMPFGCLPECIAQNIMGRTKEKIPVLTIYCDEKLAKAGLLTRLEAFVDQVKNLHNQRITNQLRICE